MFQEPRIAHYHSKTMKKDVDNLQNVSSWLVLFCLLKLKHTHQSENPNYLFVVHLLNQRKGASQTARQQHHCVLKPIISNVLFCGTAAFHCTQPSKLLCQLARISDPGTEHVQNGLKSNVSQEQEDFLSTSESGLR